jgi:hypothetical protein
LASGRPKSCKCIKRSGKGYLMHAWDTFQ